MECKYCKKELINVHPNKKYCNNECNQKYLILKHNMKFENKECCVCEICGLKSTSLSSHIKLIHKITINEYKEKYNKTLDEIILPSTRKKWGDKIKGENNGAYGHDGKYSPYSKKFIKYDNLTEQQIDNKLKKVQNKMSTSMKENQNLPSQIGYWVKQGYSEQEATELVSKRQTTFSKEVCINKYGKKEGLEIWKQRQKKWQNTLTSKPPEEIERINRAKMKFNGYSKISQKLFWSIYDNIKNDFNNIYFAEYGNKENNEYMILTEDKKCIFFDFYIKDISKVIEFDGDYWHGEKRGNQERDRIREEKIKNTGIQVYRVLERDFNNDPNNVIKECLYYIYGK